MKKPVRFIGRVRKVVINHLVSDQLMWAVKVVVFLEHLEGLLALAQFTGGY